METLVSAQRDTRVSLHSIIEQTAKELVRSETLCPDLSWKRRRSGCSHQIGRRGAVSLMVTFLIEGEESYV
jgi:hypothetical protein